MRDDEQQSQIVFNLFKECETRKEELFVPLLTVFELLWVLDSVYSIPRKEILNAIMDLLFIPILKFECRKVIQHFISVARTSKFELPDLLIASSATSPGCEMVLTFDRKASKFSAFELIG